MKKMDEGPKYVQIGSITMRRTKDGYWRDNGEWGCEVEMRDGKLVAKSPFVSVDGNEVIEVTEEEWREDNMDAMGGNEAVRMTEHEEREDLGNEISTLYERVMNGQRKDVVTELMEMPQTKALIVGGRIFYRLAIQHEDEHCHALLTIMESRI